MCLAPLVGHVGAWQASPHLLRVPHRCESGSCCLSWCGQAHRDVLQCQLLTVWVAHEPRLTRCACLAAKTLTAWIVHAAEHDGQQELERGATEWDAGTGDVAAACRMSPARCSFLPSFLSSAVLSCPVLSCLEAATPTIPSLPFLPDAKKKTI